MNWSEFFHMGGYAFYVWTSMALTLVVLVLNIVLPKMKHKQLLQQLKRSKQKREAEQE